MFDGIGNDFADKYLHTEDQHLFFILTCSCKDIENIDEQLKSFNTIIDCVLEQSRNITLLEDGNFYF